MNDRGHGHGPTIHSILSAADQNRREAKALTEAAEAPPGAAAEVYLLKHALIAAFQTTFVMDSKHVFRIAEQIAAELYRRGVVLGPHRDYTLKVPTGHPLITDMAEVIQAYTRASQWRDPVPPPEVQQHRVEMLSLSLIERGYGKVA